jgi:hypothetical protein
LRLAEPDQHPPGVIPPKTPNDVVDPAVVVMTGMQSGVDAAAGAVAVPVCGVDVVVVPVVVVVRAPPDICAAVAELVVHPVGGNSSAPGSVASVKVGTLRGSHPLAIEGDADAAPPFA